MSPFGERRRGAPPLGGGWGMAGRPVSPCRPRPASWVPPSKVDCDPNGNGNAIFCQLNRSHSHCRSMGWEQRSAARGRTARSPHRVGLFRARTVRGTGHGVPRAGVDRRERLVHVADDPVVSQWPKDLEPGPAADLQHGGDLRRRPDRGDQRPSSDRPALLLTLSSHALTPSTPQGGRRSRALCALGDWHRKPSIGCRTIAAFPGR